MKENNEIWISITTCLIAASDAITWAGWRERFNTNHPDHIRQQEIDNPNQFAYANWIAAKHLYMIHREEMDKYHNDLLNGPAYPGLTRQIEFFIAMKRVIEKEVEEQFEKQILKKEDEMPMLNTKWENDEYLFDDEDEIEQEELEDEDEDEEYVRQTEGVIEDTNEESDEGLLFDDSDLELEDKDEDDEY